MIHKLVTIVRDAGLKGLVERGLAFAYRRGVRPWLPVADSVRYAGIRIALQRRWGDRVVPQLWKPAGLEDIPDYEGALITGLRTHVLPGDRVVVVGGGMGVTATVAALQASAGTVICYEGAAECASHVRRTAALNGVSGRVRVHHAVVGRSISVYGTEPERPLVRPADLPACDVLELDCEGAELDILRELTIRPRVILVETHGIHGAPTASVESLLQALGYAVTGLGVAEPRLAEYCAEHDIEVVAGVRTPAPDRA